MEKRFEWSGMLHEVECLKKNVTCCGLLHGVECYMEWTVKWRLILCGIEFYMEWNVT